MEPSGVGAETEHEQLSGRTDESSPVGANPFRGTPPWQRGGGGWRRTLAGVGALVLTAGSITAVTWLAFRGDDGDGAGGGDVIHERCRVTEADDAEPNVDAPRLGTPAERSIATIETSYGNLDVMLWGDLAPCGVAAFGELAQAGFYNGHACDRLTTQAVSPTAVLHCGSPGRYEADEDSEETYGPGWRYRAETGMAGNNVQDVLALVTDDQGNAGSAFTLIRGGAEPTPGVSVIGGIVDGYEVLDAIAALTEEVESDGRPPMPITVYSVTITETGELPEGDNGAGETSAPTGTAEPGPGTGTGTTAPGEAETSGEFSIETTDPTQSD